MRKPITLALMAAIAVIPALCAAQDDMDDVQVETKHVAGNVYALFGRGGNIGASAGEDGVFLIDDEYAPLTEKIRNALAAISDKPVKFVINTHWHPDHTGGNENLGRGGVIIVAQDNVRERLNSEQFIERLKRKVPPSPKPALPMITFNDTITFHLNGDTVTVTHVPPAHTDGDSIVYFHDADVLHMGDVFFNSGYPFVDLSSGGDVQGMVTGAERGLALADENTRVIPGHGPLTDRDGLQAYHDMLADIIGRVRELMGEGKSLEEIQAAKLTADYDDRWGGGFIDADSFVATIYKSLKGEG